jgi:hypothetical protein
MAAERHAPHGVAVSSDMVNRQLPSTRDTALPDIGNTRSSSQMELVLRALLGEGVAKIRTNFR